jgi:hypothetical protein
MEVQVRVPPFFGVYDFKRSSHIRSEPPPRDPCGSDLLQERRMLDGVRDKHCYVAIGGAVPEMYAPTRPAVQLGRQAPGLTGAVVGEIARQQQRRS